MVLLHPVIMWGNLYFLIHVTLGSVDLQVLVSRGRNIPLGDTVRTPLKFKPCLLSGHCGFLMPKGHQGKKRSHPGKRHWLCLLSQWGQVRLSGTQGFHWDMSGAPKPFIIYFGSHSPRRECDKGLGHPTSKLSRPVEVLVKGRGH